MMLRRAVRIADQNPRVLGWIGIAMLMVAIVVIGVFADTAWAVAGLVGMASGAGGAYLLARRDSHPQRRAERAAKTARIERELDL